jgi:hypothetical protein
MGRNKIEFRNCVNCLHCKQSKDSTGNLVFAFCDIKKDRNEQPLDYWNEKDVCKKFDDMRE